MALLTFLPEKFTESLAKLPPVYFALVMATGIVSITLHFHDQLAFAQFLFYLNFAQYLALWVIYALRFVLHRDLFLKDFSDHLRAPGFFTVIAASGVLSAQCFIVASLPTVGAILAGLTALLWFLLIYGVFVLLIVKQSKPPIESGINGGWLVAIVATQSLAIVSVQGSGYFGWNESLLLFGGLLAWSFGVMLYVWVISLIFYRYMFFTFKPNDLAPPYWINMGAVAISTLAGCALLGAAENHPLLAEMRPFLKGVTFLLWSTATWWIPMLFLLGIWRHVICRFPFKYDPHYWGMVFPLGMYSACTFRLSQEFQLPNVAPVAWLFLFFGVGAWGIVFFGMLSSIWSIMFSATVGVELSKGKEAIK